MCPISPFVLSFSTFQKPLTLAPLDLSIGNQLNYPALIQTRRSHQTKASAAAIRRRSRPIPQDDNQPVERDESRHEFRQRLMNHVASLLPPPDSAHESMTGVTRQVRHTGLPVAAGRTNSDARSRNKSTLQQVASQVWTSTSFTACSLLMYVSQKFMRAKEKAFSDFRGRLHPNAITAGISSLIPLQPGDFVIGYNPSSGQSGSIVLGEGQYVFTKFRA